MLDQFRSHIRQYLDRGECVQVIAPPGFGKSRFGRSLGGLYLDTNLLQNPQELISAVKTPSSTLPSVIILDSIDSLLTPDYQSVFKYLKALRDQHKPHLSLVFFTNSPIAAKDQPILGHLFELVSEHIEYLPALESSEYDLYGFSPAPAQLKQIQKLSGGIPALVKICVFCLRDNTPLDPDANPKLKAQLEEMLAVSPHHPAYSHSQIVQDYLTRRQSRDLTASESHLLTLLESKPGRIVSKDEICQSIYPDVKNRAGITDHAIDQLVHRLRSKIKDKYTLSARRGLGYKLT